MRKHGDTTSWQGKYVTLAVISPPGVARGRFVGGHQSGLARCKSPPLFKRGAPSCSSQRQRQREPWGASPRRSASTYLPPSVDGGLGRCIRAVSCGRRHPPSRVGGRDARVPCVFACARSLWPSWASRPPGRILVRLTFPLAVLSFVFAQPPSGWGCPHFVVFLFCPLFCFFNACAPVVSSSLCFRPWVSFALAPAFSFALFRSSPPPLFFVFVFFPDFFFMRLVVVPLFLFFFRGGGCVPCCSFSWRVFPCCCASSVPPPPPPPSPWWLLPALCWFALGLGGGDAARRTCGAPLARPAAFGAPLFLFVACVPVLCWWSCSPPPAFALVASACAFLGCCVLGPGRLLPHASAVPCRLASRGCVPC